MSPQFNRMRALRWLCWLEATTLLVLVLIAVPLKHLSDWPLGVSVMGPLHGLVFIAFGWAVISRWAAEEISRRMAIKLVLAATLPLGGFYSAWLLTRQAGIGGAMGPPGAAPP